MEDWTREAIDLWQQNRTPITQELMDGIARNPHLHPDSPFKHLSFQDCIQMVDGFGAMIAEELQGLGADIRDTYMYSVIPGLLEQGQSLSDLVGIVTMNAVLVYKIVMSTASDKNRDQIARFFVNWYVKFNADIVKVGSETTSGG